MIITKKSGENITYRIDIDDIEKIEQYKWYDTKGYAKAHVKNTKPYKDIMLHRYLMDVENISHYEVIVDHINRDPKDNRKSNLRLVNPTESSINRGTQSNNKSGISGVFFQKKSNRWQVYIKYKYKHKFMGSSYDLEEAIKIRLQAELDVFGEEFAPNKHLFEQYNIHTRNPEVLETFFENKRKNFPTARYYPH